MKAKHLLNRKNFLAFSSLLLVTVVLNLHSSMASPVDDPLGLDLNRQSERDRADANASAGASERIVELSQRLGVSESDLTSFFKDLGNKGMNASQVNAWKVLLSDVSVEGKRNASPSDFENADLMSQMMGSYIKVRASNLPGEFHLSEIDLMDVDHSFSPEQKKNFSRVLERAANIAAKSRAVTADEAFEKALGELGYLEQYRQGCRR